MKKISAILMMFVFLLGMVACSSAGEKKTVTMTPQEMEEKIAEVLGEENYFCNKEITQDWMESSYQFDFTQIESYVAKQNSISAVNPDTVIILKVADGYQEEAVSLLNKLYRSKVEYSKLYTFSVPKVEAARIYQSGQYVMFLLAGERYLGEDNEEGTVIALREYEKIDAVLEEIFGEKLKNLAKTEE